MSALLGIEGNYQSIVVALIIVAGLTLRLWIAPSGGHPGDLPVLARWGTAAQEHGWLGLYATSDANYPPLGTAIITGADALYSMVRPPVPMTPADPIWLLTLKIPAILADTLLAILVALTTSRRAVLWVAATAFNPALIIMSAWWGQLDSVVVLFAAGAVLAATRDRPFIAGLLLTVATLVKPQGVIVAPIVLLSVIIHDDPFRRIAHLVTGALTATLVTLGPFIATEQFSLVAARSIALIASSGWLTVNALNIWYLATNGAGNWAFNAPLLTPDTTSLILGLSARSLGVLLLLAWTSIVLILTWRLRHRPGAWFLGGALLVIGAFLFPTQVHERYLLGALPLAILYAVTTDREPAGIILALWLTFILTLNLLWAAPILPTFLSNFMGHHPTGMMVALTTLIGAIATLTHHLNLPTDHRER